ncbi:hypothetical protein C8R44DRAFT_864208 [Mycena epipterygia]|nr:hypothetical protein C8R44DRAFT_864208 [Mycena epipterygia]
MDPVTLPDASSSSPPTILPVPTSISRYLFSPLRQAFSIQDLVSGYMGDEVLHVPAVVVVGIAFLTKLALFIYCYSVRSKNSQPQRPFCEGLRHIDVLCGREAPLVNRSLRRPPHICRPNNRLGHTLYRQFLLLAGIVAPMEFQQLVIYKAMTFADGIKQIDSCAVYHAGPADTPLWKAPNVS